MGGAGIDLAGPAQLLDGLGGAAERAGGVHYIVQQDAGLALHIAYEIHNLGLVGPLPALVHDGHVGAQLHGEGSGSGCAAHVGGHHHHVLVGLAEHLDKVLHKELAAHQIVHGDVKKALNLGGVEVHGEDPVGAGGGYQIGHQLCGYGITAFGFPVLTGIAEIRYNGGDPAGRGPAHGVRHYQQLHQIVVYRVTGGLYDENILASDRLGHGDGALSVGKLRHVCVAQSPEQLGADALCQSGIGVAGKYLDFFAV